MTHSSICHRAAIELPVKLVIIAQRFHSQHELCIGKLYTVNCLLVKRHWAN